MKTNFDDAYEKFKSYDFADAKPVTETPVLAKLQAENKQAINVPPNLQQLCEQARELGHHADQTETLHKALECYLAYLKH